MADLPLVDDLCVCGAGTMGGGIARLAAQAGYRVCIFEKSATALQKAREGWKAQVEKSLTQQGLDPGQARDLEDRLRFSQDPAECRAPFILEAVPENLSIKAALWATLEAGAPPASIFASNTSSLSLTQMARGLKDPGRLVGMHFFNPPSQMRLVEIVSTPWVRPEAIRQAGTWAARLQKQAVYCRDQPGFIVNRIARPYYLEALRLRERGAASCTVVDQLMESVGFRMGPFRLMDLIGNDVNLAVSTQLYQALGRPERLRPVSLQEQMVARGRLGRKSGEGYYPY